MVDVEPARADADAAVRKPGSVFDFDGDGYADLAAGMPDRSVDHRELAGAVEIVYGSSRGLAASASDFLTQNSRGIKGRARTWYFVGQSVTSGDFDGDGYADLVTRAGNDALVVYGGKGGLTTRDQLLHVNRYGLGLISISSFPTASGDFNGDGFADLVVSDRGYEDESGRLVVFPGSRTGLLTTKGIELDRDTPGVPGVKMIEDNFGAQIAVGDVTGDGYADLAATSTDGRDEDDEVPDREQTGPVIHLFPGSASGLRAVGSTIVSTQDLTPDVINFHPESGFGAAVISDLDGDGFGDLLSGDSGAGAGAGCRDGCGVVVVIPGSAAGLVRQDRQIWNQNSHGVPGTAERSDGFGATLAVGDLNADPYPDLAIGVPGESLGSTKRAGAVNVLYGSPTGLSGAGAQVWNQSSPTVKGKPRRGDQFGAGSLRILDFGKGRPADLAVHSPYDRPGGSVNVLYGSSHGLTARDQLWRSSSRGLAGRTSHPIGGFGGECC